jgi:hypothetical protein
VPKSAEYPDLAWVTPRSYTKLDRDHVQFIVIHDTEGSSHAQSAEDGAAYDARRTDGTSAHYFVDNNSIVQCVKTTDASHTALYNGNMKGIHYELCARASFSESKWLSPDYGLPMLKLAAKQVARDCIAWKIPARKIGPSQMRNGEEGICGHVDVTYAYPEDGGDHTDPGSNFPWPEFIRMVQDEMELELNDADKAWMKENILLPLTKVDSQGEANNNTQTSVIGRNALGQGVPNPITKARGGAKKTAVWDLLEDMAQALLTLDEQLVTVGAELAEIKAQLPQPPAN